MKTKPLSTRRLHLASGLAVLAILLVVAISYRSAVAFRDSAQWVWHSHEVLEALQDLRVDMGNIESSYRGFVLTGNESDFESYRASAASVTRTEAIVRNLTADNPAQQSRLSSLERLTARTIQLAGRGINLRQTKGMESAVDAIQSGSDARVMDDIQGVVRGLEGEERRLLVVRNAEEERRSRLNNAVLIIGAVLGVLIIGVVGWKVQRENARRGLAEEALEDSEEKYRTLVYGSRTTRFLCWTHGAGLLPGMVEPNEYTVARAKIFPVKISHGFFLPKTSNGASCKRYSGRLP